jgi:hypothetical protein
VYSVLWLQSGHGLRNSASKPLALGMGILCLARFRGAHDPVKFTPIRVCITYDDENQVGK